MGKQAEEKFAGDTRDQWHTKDFAEAIAEMYETSPDTKRVLHHYAVHVANRNAKQLYTREDCQRFREVAKETPKFVCPL